MNNHRTPIKTSAMGCTAIGYLDILPELGKGDMPGFLQAVIYHVQKWDDSKDDEVPDLLAL